MIVATLEAPKNVTLGPVAGARSVTVAFGTGLPVASTTSITGSMATLVLMLLIPPSPASTRI